MFSYFALFESRFSLFLLGNQLSVQNGLLFSCGLERKFRGLKLHVFQLFIDRQVVILRFLVLHFSSKRLPALRKLCNKALYL